MIWLRRMHAFISRWRWLVDLGRLLGLVSFLPFMRRHRTVAGEDGAVVVVRIDGLGDAILFARWLGGLRQAYPQRRLICMVRPAVAPLLHMMDVADEIIPVDTWALLFGIKARCDLFAHLRRLHAVEVLVPMIGGDVFWADALVLGLGAKRSVGVAEASHWPPLRWVRRRIYSDLVQVADEPGMFGKNSQIVNHFCSGVAPLPLDAIRARLYPHPTRAQHFVLFLGANFEYKRWPVDRFIELGARIQGLTGWTPVVCGGSLDAHLVADSLHRLPGDKDLSGTPTLEVLTGTLASARLVVCSDTGPAHLASALGTPLIVIVGGGQPELFFPYPAEHLHPGGPQLVVEKGRACAGCDWHCPYSVDPCRPRPCVEEISLEDTWSMTQAFLKSLQLSSSGHHNP